MLSFLGALPLQTSSHETDEKASYIQDARVPKLIHISKRQECGEVIECGEGVFGKVLVG